MYSNSLVIVHFSITIRRYSIPRVPGYFERAIGSGNGEPGGGAQTAEGGSGREVSRIQQAKSEMEKIKELREQVQRCRRDLAVEDRKGEDRKGEDRKGEKGAGMPSTQRTEAVDVGMAEPNVTPPPEVVEKDATHCGPGDIKTMGEAVHMYL